MRTIVGVLRGGPSSEYEVSLKTGGAVLEALNRDKFDVRDLFIDRQGVWHRNGISVLPARALTDVDVIFNAVHGEYGEDGRLHQTLDLLKIPYTGARSASSILAFNKHHTNSIARSLGIKVPYSKVVEETPNVEELAFNMFRSFPHPAVVKPVIGGSSVGITIANDLTSLMRGLERAWEVSPKALVQEYIAGREATVGVIDHFRNEKAYALLPAEITSQRVPGLFSPSEKQGLTHAARALHESLQLDHYSRSDFIVSRRGIYFLETNSAAGVGLHKESILPKALQAVGVKLADFLEHVINLARRKKDE